jgi:hypothetical protein
MLGQDRVGYVDGPPIGSSNNTEQFNYAGTVDIVAGLFGFFEQFFNCDFLSHVFSLRMS